MLVLSVLLKFLLLYVYSFRSQFSVVGGKLLTFLVSFLLFSVSSDFLLHVLVMCLSISCVLWFSFLSDFHSRQGRKGSPCTPGPYSANRCVQNTDEAYIIQRRLRRTRVSQTPRCYFGPSSMGRSWTALVIGPTIQRLRFLLSDSSCPRVLPLDLLSFLDSVCCSVRALHFCTIHTCLQALVTYAPMHSRWLKVATKQSCILTW